MSVCSQVVVQLCSVCLSASIPACLRPYQHSHSVVMAQAPAAEALDDASLEGLNKRLNALESAAKEKLVEQVKKFLNHLFLGTECEKITREKDKMIGPHQCHAPWLSLIVLDSVSVPV